MLGALIAGGAVGYGQADDKNVATHNQQAMAENLVDERAAVENMYTQATEKRHIEQAHAGVTYTGQVVSNAADQYLASKGLHTPIPNDPDPDHAATDAQQKDAITIGTARSGMLSPQVIAETSSKEAVQVAQADAKLEAAKIIGQYNVMARAANGRDAAEIKSAADGLKAAGTDYTSQVNAYEKILGNPLLGEDMKAPARSAYQTLIRQGPPKTPGATGLLGGGAPDNASNVDALFPPKNQ